MRDYCLTALMLMCSATQLSVHAANSPAKQIPVFALPRFTAVVCDAVPAVSALRSNTAALMANANAICDTGYNIHLAGPLRLCLHSASKALPPHRKLTGLKIIGYTFLTGLLFFGICSLVHIITGEAFLHVLLVGAIAVGIVAVGIVLFIWLGILGMKAAFSPADTAT